ncbi:hypothetical protein J4476_03460 [Candidatus Woesearchaeota archaeon]|nr:hypothetical protein [Candidatus Woesearchaeota archaeon]
METVEYVKIGMVIGMGIGGFYGCMTGFKDNPETSLWNMYSKYHQGIVMIDTVIGTVAGAGVGGLIGLIVNK